MEPDQSNQSDPKLQNVYNPLSVMRPGEQVLCEIRRHPIGILGVYFMAGAIIAIAIAAAVVAPSHIPNFTTQYREAVALGALIVSVLALLYAYIARVVYTGNRWILTDDSLTQVTQDGLFRKHSSQLSLANLEDVTVDQNGIVQAMFGYGILHAETAGERSKFVFLFCPKPNEYARKILAARENFIMNEPDKARRANDKLMTPGMMRGFGAEQSQAASVSPVPPAVPPQPMPQVPSQQQEDVTEPPQIPPAPTQPQ